MQRHPTTVIDRAEEETERPDRPRLVRHIRRDVNTGLSTADVAVTAGRLPGNIRPICGRPFGDRQRGSATRDKGT
jgi:hypothetical protein